MATSTAAATIVFDMSDPFPLIPRPDYTDARPLVFPSKLTTLAADFYDRWRLPASGAREGDLSMASENIVEFTDQNFEQEVLQSNVPVLVDFWAEWCMPCRMLSPTIEKLAKEYAGKVKVGKVDTDANRDTALKFSISNIPTVILFRNGQASQRFVGLKPEKEFKAALDAAANG
jgi:thioredoxin 1